MDGLGYLSKIDFEDCVRRTHQAITRKFPTGNVEFDAWYTRKDYVSQKLLEIGREIAQRVREDRKLQWEKVIPEQTKEALAKVGTSAEHWEDGPDGTLAGVAILAAGWVANQAAAKSRDNPNDYAWQVFETCVRPLIIDSMEFGCKIAYDEKKS